MTPENQLDPLKAVSKDTLESVFRPVNATWMPIYTLWMIAPGA